MKYFQLKSCLRRPVSISSISFCNRLPFSCTSNHSHLMPYLSIGGCKFFSFSNTPNPQSPLEPSLTPTSVLVQEFAQVLHRGDLISVANHPVSAECQKWLPDLDDHQFFTILSNFDTFFQQKGGDFCRGPNPDNPVHKLMQNLDSECSKRFADGDYSRALSLLETYRFFLAVHNSKMIQRVLRRNCKTAFSSPKPLLRRYLAFMNQNRLWDKPFNFYSVEYALQFRLDELDVPDVCAFLQAYIVTLNRFISNDELLVSIFAKFINQLDSIHKSHLLTFLLFANRLMYLYQYATITPYVTKLLDFLNSNFEAYPLTCHIHAATLCTKLLIYRPQYLQKICDAVVKIPQVSVDAFLHVGTTGNAQARTQSFSVADTSSPLSTPSSVDKISSDTENWLSEVSQPTTVVEEVTSVSPAIFSALRNELPPATIKGGNSSSHSNSFMVALFPYDRNTLPAMHIVNFTNTVAFFNCTHLAAQMKQFLESSPVSQYFLDENPRLYVSAITYLACAGIFSHLISTFLSEEFLLKTYKGINVYKVSRHIPFLDATMQIECPNYQGQHLKPEFRSRMNDYLVAVCPKKVRFVEKHTFQAIYKMYADEAAAKEYVLYKYTMLEAATLLGELFGGDDYTHVCRALPHLSGENVIWCTDTAGSPLKLSAQMKESQIINFEVIDPEQRWFILVCSSHNIHDKEGARPMVVNKEVPKVRQLKLLGFQVVEVVHEEWEMMSRDQRISVLKKKLELPIAE